MRGRNYVLRRILRRAVRYGRRLGFTQPFLAELVDTLVESFGQVFPELSARASTVKEVLNREEASFNETLDRGLDLFDAETASAGKVSGEFAFKLYDTYGFPIDLTALLAEERGLDIDMERFNRLMEEQRERARAARKSESPVCLPGEVDQNANIMYVDAAERMGLAADVCPLPSAEVGCAIVDDYPQVGSSFITSSMPCDGSLGAALFMDRYMKKLPSFTLTPPQRFNEPETNAYAVKDLKNCIRFIEETYDVKWDWDAFWKKAEEYNKTTQCMLDKWDVNCTPYPQVIGSALSLQREYEFQTAACLDSFMTKQDEKVTKMMLKGYEEDREADRRDYKYRAIVWCCPAHYYTHFTTWAEHTWGIRTLVDMESMLSYHFYHIGDKEQALTDMAMAYERMMMRSHSNGGYVNALDECWKMCEKFNANIVIMYDHVSCKNFGGLHGLFEDQARERGIHLIWVQHDLMDPRTVSRKAMRDAVNKYMSTVFREEPLDPTYLDYSDELTW